MRLTDEQMDTIKGHLLAGVRSLSAEQVIRFGFGMFAIGAVVAEGLLNNRQKAIEARERAAGVNKT